MPKKLFISQPVNSLTDEQIKTERNAFPMKLVKNILKRKSNSLIRSLNQHLTMQSPFGSLESHLNFCQQWISFTLVGDKARGCIMEHEAAVRYLSDTAAIITE